MKKMSLGLHTEGCRVEYDGGGALRGRGRRRRGLREGGVEVEGGGVIVSKA
jgi:hypothetical protein